MQEGGWVILRAILDDELLEVVDGMIYFKSWRNALAHKFDFMEVKASLGRGGGRWT